MIRCWQCGAEPTGLAEVTAYGDLEPRYIPTGWPPGDHPHAVDPPTPAELQAGGYAALAQILDSWR
jgi:hypothetical protein